MSFVDLKGVSLTYRLGKETTLALAEHPNIVAVKEASGDLAQISEIIRNAPEDFRVLSGDDSLTLAVIAMGGHGVVSVISNVVPAKMAWLCASAFDHNMAEAQTLHRLLDPLMHAAFCESNPIPIKAALAMVGRLTNILRLPLVPLDPKYDALVRDSLVQAGGLAP